MYEIFCFYTYIERPNVLLEKSYENGG